jgi:hypothetical protein
MRNFRSLRRIRPLRTAAACLTHENQDQFADAFQTARHDGKRLLEAHC